MGVTAQDQQSRAAYDLIDRFLRNNLDDADYAEYSAALDVTSAARALPAGMEPVAFIHPLALKFLENPSYSLVQHQVTLSATKHEAACVGLFTESQVLAMGRVPVDAEAIDMARAVHKKLKALRKKDVPMDAYVLLADAQYVIERLIAAAPLPPAAQERNPLTDDQIEDLRGEANRGMDIERDDYFKAFRDAEFIHGITNTKGE